MPAELTIRQDGSAEMAYTGKTPWHGLGTYVDHPMTAAEAITLGQLDWTVSKQPLYTQTRKQTGLFAIRRDDTQEYFAAVGNHYQPVQQVDAFTMMDGIVGDQLASYEVVGSLRGGRWVWMLLKLRESLTIGGTDQVDRYLLLSNSHDGSSALDIRWTPIRVVCGNTLSAALTDKSAVRFRTSHTSNIEARMKDARKVLGLASQYFEQFGKDAEVMVGKRMTSQQQSIILGDLFTIDDARVQEIIKDGGSAKRANEKAAVEVYRLSSEGLGNEPFAGTAWGLYNGLTQWIDHERPVRGDSPQERRMEDSWFNWSGTMVPLRQKAFDLLSV